MSTIGSLNTGIDMSPSNTTSQGSIIHNNESPPAVQEDRYDICTLTISSILREQLSGSLNFSPAAALMDGIGFSLGPYIECDLKWFNSGIEYSPTYFQKVFPAGWVIITDARIKIKNILHIDFGSVNANIMITSQATAFLSELDGISTAMGQPVERGKYFFSIYDPILILQQQSSAVRRRVLQICPSLVQALRRWYVILIMILARMSIYSQVTDERKSFMRTMKDQAVSLVEDTRKIALGGYGLRAEKNISDKALTIRIFVILEITMIDQPISSVAFTRHEISGVSRSYWAKFLCTQIYELEAI